MRTLLRLGIALLLTLTALGPAWAGPPNVLIVITDDQGFGDLGRHGNPVVRTPNLDAFGGQAVWLKNFYVSPVCSPTRSSLLTGYYNYRVGVVDTFIGRSMMRPGVKTLAEQLAAAGYRTGLFGKWHLGDNHPLRPEDRGFQETLWHQGGGLAQPADAPGVDPKTAYFDPVLKKNGREVKAKGYCTDVFTDAALDFIGADPSKPFFAHVAFNAPHDPFQAPAGLAARYRGLDLTPAGFPKIGQPWPGGKGDGADIANAYAMIENIDANFARLLKALDDRGLARDTIVVFLTDNGPGGNRFNAGLRNRKGTVYEGGVRVPCYVRWPGGGLKPGATVEPALAHVDFVPTLLDACGARPLAGQPPFDGRSFAGLLTNPGAAWPDRTLFFQWHRGDAPEKFRAFAARGPRYKLVQAAGVAPAAKWAPKFELFDIPADPYELRDLAAEKPEEAAALKARYEAWFADVSRAGFDPPRIVVGSDAENPVRLSRQDWRGAKAGWAPDSLGHWVVTIARPGRYRVTVHSSKAFDAFAGTVAYQPKGGAAVSRPFSGDRRASPQVVDLPAGDAQVDARVEAEKKPRGADHVTLEYLGPSRK